MVKKRIDTNQRYIKFGKLEMGMKSFALLISGIVLGIFILKSGYDFSIGGLSCNGKPAEIKVNINKPQK